jgi:hypothetical protein
MLEGFARYFRDAEFASVRGTAVAQLATSDDQEVVADSAACQAVVAAALAILRTHDNAWVQSEPHGYDFAVLRYGPYYAVLMQASVDPAGNPPHYLPLMIFRVSDLTYLRTIMV